MELHSIKEKESKSKSTGGCPLNGQMKWWIQKVWKRSVASERSVLCMIQVC